MLRHPRFRSFLATLLAFCLVSVSLWSYGAEATADAVSAYLRSPPTMASSLSFRSNVKPEVTAQIPFNQAVETSQLTPAQKEALQALGD